MRQDRSNQEHRTHDCRMIQSHSQQARAHDRGLRSKMEQGLARKASSLGPAPDGPLPTALVATFG